MPESVQDRSPDLTRGATLYRSIRRSTRCTSTRNRPAGHRADSPTNGKQRARSNRLALQLRGGAVSGVLGARLGRLADDGALQ